MTQTHPNAFFDRMRIDGNPVAHPQSSIISDQARFTILTTRLVRLEWSETGTFEDRGTFAFPHRYVEPPLFVTYVQDDLLTIDTGALILRYRQKSGPFDSANLSITFKLHGKLQTWVPGTPDHANLRGTLRTLDDTLGATDLDAGLISRAGWSLFDDSQHVLFTPDGSWIEPRPEHEHYDWYFFGYGHAYQEALRDYATFGGRIPLIPRFVLGAWWSRYWAYSDQELRTLVDDFANNDFPLDVLVVDMDWHTTDSWTGYTWNRELFPDPTAFLSWVHEHGLHTTLNLHPAEGVQSFEAIYPRFAEAMGIDPASGTTIPFRVSNKKYMQHYFELLHHPLEDQGVDFWWMDWQQGEQSEIPGLDPLLWINHLHFHDSTRRGQRPMLYSRWGGLGNHRYHIGFSGDTATAWAALQFQPYLTATAANVGFGWWSHDIGGHFGVPTPELYVRWVQLGTLSPCLRLHSSNDPLFERRPWMFGDTATTAAREAFHLRYRLVPYLYTMARQTIDTSISLCRPLYYEYPESEAAYQTRYQYFLGDQIIAAPIVYPANPETDMATTDVWVPPGTWIDYQTLETFTGPRWVRLSGDLLRIPMLVKAGAIIPLAPAAHTTGAILSDQLELAMFPGADGMFRLYEDDGSTNDYRHDACEWTTINSQMHHNRLELHIAPVEGHCAVLARQRRYTLHLRGTHKPTTIHVNGTPHNDWQHNTATLTTTINLVPHDKQQPLDVMIQTDGAISALDATHNSHVIYTDVQRLLAHQLPNDGQKALLDTVLAMDGPGIPDAIARLGGPFARMIQYEAPSEARQCLGRTLVAAPTDGSRYGVQITWQLLRDGLVEKHTITHNDVVDNQIIDSPFAFTGDITTMVWEAHITLWWCDTSFTTTYTSGTLFPLIPHWKVTFYDERTEERVLDQLIGPDQHLNKALEWHTYQQQIADTPGLHDVYSVKLAHLWRADATMSAYAVAAVVSPVEQTVLLYYQSQGELTCYVNGERLDDHKVSLTEQGQLPFVPVTRPRKTNTIQLRAGTNTIIVHSQADREHPRWRFSVILTQSDGTAFTNLHYDHNIRPS
ncbi:MAG: Alpha-glucosidase, glycosyl hydrolase family GH31 [Chloroflexi bacterium AL-W]|nr:Alpha-glucosidase, glycosyl hydrolase family GH31 [Chloroflexi bacterium AL-N1]NOK67696.1 Alpha-glucosidase, glycosyl hydrolase family GH31 [Chloroflexi bacterium AL-N10]NOK75534.1 Alpha-glucosidase, glycosyl hydrolase family GH31 [Chloroflexi bacterium AL-N5]NOK82322.1 Alpha-glucosidase, glycosyl hydrolase family GH31 [Chloroflexi bacterium AL-W]NOK90167.1 Alpha-glucosidase, glycosyl hydrolase family GH31 [Chloroflexi bacterium AL-N15]